MNRNFSLIIWLAFCFAVLTTSLQPANASILLKSGGQNAQRLRAKFVKADVEIERQFAATELTMVFGNETSSRTEADFIYTLPPHTVVTSFAYWFGKEKVQARVVEKELAASIYESIRTTNRDPALVEMIDENTFRARIFPIEAYADLKVEMRLVQVLPSSEQGAVYELPLGESDEDQVTLDAFHVKVRVQSDADLLRVGNNFDLPVSQKAGSHVITLSQLDYRPPRNLKVDLMRKPQNLQAELLSEYSALADERDGFFALALTPQLGLDNPRVQISGVETSQLWPQKLPDIKANQEIVIFGRYKNQGQATVTLTGTTAGKAWSQSRSVQFLSSRGDGIALKGWVAKRMAELSKDADNRRAVIALSMRFGLPGKFTSWLAVPREEMKRYRAQQESLRQQRLYSNYNILGEQLVREILDGHPNGQKARNLKKQLNEISQLGGWNAKNQLNSVLENKMYSVAAQLAELRATQADRKQIAGLHRQLGLLAKARGVRPDGYIQRAVKERSSGGAYEVAQKLAEELRNNRGEGPVAQKLRLRLKALSGKDATRPYGTMWNLLSRDMNALADEYAAEKYQPRPDAVKMQALRRRIDLMGRDMGVAGAVAIQGAQNRWAAKRYSKLAPELIQARRAAAPDPKQIANLEREIGRIARLTGASPKSSLESAEHRWEHYRRHELGKFIIDEKHKSSPDQARIAAMRNELSRISNGRPERWIDIYAGHYLFSPEGAEDKKALEKVRDDILAELKKEQPEKAKITELNGRFEQIWKRAGYEMPWWRWRGDEWLQKTREDIIAVRRDLKAANESGDIEKVAEFDAKEKQLLSSVNYIAEARWGDPLISVEAPADAMQVIAVMPNGEIKKLVFNAASRHWEARFDIPMYAAEGEYSVTVIVVFKDSVRRQFVLLYKLDLTPPTAIGATSKSADDSSLNLSLETGNDSDRVEALLPWGERVELRAGAAEANEIKRRFSTVVPVPNTYQSDTSVVTFIVTDNAHNRTSLTVEMENSTP